MRDRDKTGQGRGLGRGELLHVGHVVVDGAINGARIRENYASYLDHLGEDGSLDPDAIAESYWYMHTQPRSVWTFEVDVRPFKETW